MSSALGSENGHTTRESLMRETRSRHPPFIKTVLEDARVAALFQGEPWEYRSRGNAVLHVLKLAWKSDAFAAHVLYRAKASMQARGIPVLPRIAHRLAMVIGQVTIGDPVVMHPGVYILHGQIVIDGITEIRHGVTIAPFVTIGLRAGDVVGPTVEPNVHIGSGAKVLGRITVGTGAQIGANAVVLEDVPEGATVVGVPAKTPGRFAPIDAGATDGPQQ
jgi:serine O-acetyltransferase